MVPFRMHELLETDMKRRTEKGIYGMRGRT